MYQFFPLDAEDADRVVVQKLLRAVDRKNVDQVAKLWHNFERRKYRRAHWVARGAVLKNQVGGEHAKSEQPNEDKGSGDASTNTNPNQVYDLFLSAFMTLRQPGTAVDVWNSMLSAGLDPKQSSWNAMLDGCRTARDVESLESVWKRMKDQSVKPDARCWTSRIDTLMLEGWFDLGVTALNTMARDWRNAAMRAHGVKDEKLLPPELGDIDGFVKPTIETINAALRGLLRYGKINTAQKILPWASKFDVQPDLITYNTLLDYLVRDGQIESALKLLKEMAESGVKPDVVTFTTVLDGVFRRSTADPSSNSAVVDDLFNQMEAANIKANAYSYGILIDGLLKEQSNLAAAQAVLDHMVSRRHKPSSHINTMFASYYLFRSPPDMAAANALWARVATDGTAKDHVLYDRFIEGYARAGEVEMTMEVLQAMMDDGKTPSWHALVMVLAMLARVGDWLSASDLVADVVRQEGVFKYGIRGSKAQDRFWELVRELKLQGLQVPDVRYDVGTHVANDREEDDVLVEDGALDQRRS